MRVLFRSIERGHTRIGDDRFGHAVLRGASGGCASGGDEGEKTKRAGRLRHLPAGDARGACQGVPSVFAHVSRPHCFRLPGWKKRAGLLGSAGPLDAPGGGETAAGRIEPSDPTHSEGYSAAATADPAATGSSRRSEENTSELQSLMRISYAVFCLKKKTI